MKSPKSVVGIAFVLLALAAGCARHSSTEPGSAMPRAEGASALADSGLTGTWRGTFGQVMTGDSGLIHGDTLYGVTMDPATKRVTVSVELHKVIPTQAP